MTTEPGHSGNEAAGHESAPEPSDEGFHPVAAFRQWRNTRPFWGAVFVLLGGALILLSEKAPVSIVVHIGLQGLAGYLIPAIMLLCGLLLLVNPVQRTFYSLLAILLALGSWITSNFGGFFVGMLLGLIGGSLAFAWEQRDGPRREDRAGRHKTSPPGLTSQRASDSHGITRLTGQPDDTREFARPGDDEPGSSASMSDAHQTHAAVFIS